jgi:signal transduction histidine kinase
LTLARRIAEAHGGRLSVESVKGEGATFTVWLPVPGASEQGAPDEDVATGAHGA